MIIYISTSLILKNCCIFSQKKRHVPCCICLSSYRTDIFFNLLFSHFLFWTLVKSPLYSTVAVSFFLPTIFRQCDFLIHHNLLFQTGENFLYLFSTYFWRHETDNWHHNQTNYHSNCPSIDWRSNIGQE